MLGELRCLYLETTHHKPAELEDHMKIARVTMRIALLLLNEAVTQTLEGSDKLTYAVFFSSFILSCLG